MSSPLTATGLLLAALAVLTALPMKAEAYSRAQQASTWRQLDVKRPKKDCTRLNGRVGYYANPWCTPREQERWDRWEALQVSPSRSR